jgi:hypothetical protein
MSIHLSYSQVSKYLDCSRHWQANYRQSVRDPMGEALIFGSAVHLVIENFLRDKTRSMSDMWETAWPAAVADPKNKSTIWDETPEVCAATGRRIFGMTETFDLLSTIEPKMMQVPKEKGSDELISMPMIEREIHASYADVPDVVGYIDCIASDGVPIDLKTAGRMWSDDKPAKELQPLFYLAALEQLGEHDHQFKFRHVVITKTQNPRIVMFETQRMPGEMQYIEEVIRGVWRGIGDALFIPNPMSMWCDPKYCGLWDQCAGKYK